MLVLRFLNLNFGLARSSSLVFIYCNVSFMLVVELVLTISMLARLYVVS